MPEISIRVREKIAQTVGSPQLVCGNSDYAVTFDFDAEWDDYDAKTARVVWLDKASGRLRHADVLFDGNAALLPAIYRADQVLIGVYAGDIRTTTPARVPCIGCITDDAPQHDDPPEDVYEQLLAYLEQLAGGGNMPDIAVLISNGVQFNAVPEVIEEPTPIT